jgi:acyl dehydratase
MALDPGLLGAQSAPVEHSWRSSDVLLYAVAVGAGQQDPTRELEFTTENTAGRPLRALPTYANLLDRSTATLDLGDIDHSGLVHAEQAVTLHQPLANQGSARSTSRIVGVYDKGAAALVVAESSVVDAATAEPLATCRTSMFIRGEGGFGGERGPKPQWAVPDREADVVIDYQTRPEQALIYRLTGDRNPLHSDPAFAARGGFSQPILHGMCTYGYTGRALLHAVCGSDPTRFRSMSARFSQPVLPGAPLSVSVWIEDDAAYFRTTSNGVMVIDQGRLLAEPQSSTVNQSPLADSRAWSATP